MGMKMGDGPAGGIDTVPSVLIESYESVPTPENRVRTREVFKRLRPDITSHFGEKYTNDLAVQLGVDEE